MKSIRRIAAFIFALVLCIGLVPIQARADLEVWKLNVALSGSECPVAFTPVNTLSASTSTEGCYVVSLAWYDSAGNPAYGDFTTGNYTAYITVSTRDGYFFASGMPAYLNTKACDYTVSDDMRTVTLTRVYTPYVWAIAVNKSPGSENVDIGGWASFAASANYCNGYDWVFISPDGSEKIDSENIGSRFPGVTTSGNGDSKINVYNIPAEMDSWRIMCVFQSPGGNANSGEASIMVRGAVEPVYAPLPTEEPTAEEAEEASGEEAAEEGATIVEAVEEHTHSYNGTFKSDDTNHWIECLTCGEVSGTEAHDFEWTTVEEATKKKPGSESGVCTVCGFETARVVEFQKKSKADGESAGMPKFLKGLLIAVGGIVGLILLVLFFQYERDKARRKRRARAAGRSGSYGYTNTRRRY